MLARIINQLRLASKYMVNINIILGINWTNELLIQIGPQRNNKWKFV